MEQRKDDLPEERPQSVKTDESVTLLSWDWVGREGHDHL
jgi:hypothetical protein